ncbi:FAD-dependent oxidoreductase [Epibacterium ulvae]|uniref:FAD-dependent oxidoreductase n=1 Tax=Epibacterium ulvae TaxID=1156985 RepID=UPI00248F8289|nr:FAD-dependent oxidoreductase [Epibacterium ulvae]
MKVMQQTIETCDAIIVGAGVLGASISRKLLKEGFKVRCFDANYIRDESATLASGAMLGAIGEVTEHELGEEGGAELRYRLESAKRFPEWVQELTESTGQPVSFNKGTAIIANNNGKDDLANILAMEKIAISSGTPCSWINATDLPFLKPHMAQKPLKCLHLPQEGYVDSQQLLRTLHYGNSSMDSDWLVHSDVRTLVHDGSKITGVTTNTGEDYQSDTVILCCGVSINSLLKNGLETVLPTILGGKGSSLVVSANVQSEMVIRSPNRDFACGIHVVPRGSGQHFIGATNRISDTPGASGGVTVGEMHALLHSATQEINTRYRTAKILSSRSGVRPLCADGHPAIGRTKFEGLLVATGTYRNGVLMSPLIAEEIKDILTGKSQQASVFEPINRSKLTFASNVGSPLRSGVKDLVSFIQEPHGSLPYNRSEELADLLEVLITAVASSSVSLNQLSEKTGIDLSTIDRAEKVPSLLYAAHESAERLRNSEV